MSSPPPPRPFYPLSCLSSVFGLSVTYFPPHFLHIVSAFKGSKSPHPPFSISALSAHKHGDTNTPRARFGLPAPLRFVDTAMLQEAAHTRVAGNVPACVRVLSPLHVDMPLVLSDHLPARPGGVKGLWLWGALYQ